MTIKEIMNKIKNYSSNLVLVTGGEPLFQKNCIELLNTLINKKYNVLLETSGSLTIKDVPKEVVNIIDFKCPSSKMEKKNLWENINYLKPTDEVKFVIENKDDYEWSKNIIKKYKISDLCTVLLSPSYNKISPKTIVDWILTDNLNVRFQLQIHKEIWKEDKRGV
tara:strand:- start:143 stop:637 length:495 start_codon:yes stop_codon:yes gene_type:complete